MLNLEMTQKSIQCCGAGAWGARITFVPTEITDPRSERVLLPQRHSPGWHDHPDFLRSRESDKWVVSQDGVSSPQYQSGNLTIGVSAQWSPLTSTPSPTFPLQGKSWINTFLKAQGPSPHLLGGTSSSGHIRWGQDQSPSHSPHWGCRCSLSFWSSHLCPPKWTLQWPVKQKGKWRGEDVSSRLTVEGHRSGWGNGGLKAWGHACASVHASVQRAWILFFQLKCNWHKIMLVSGIQHNASIFVYVVKWFTSKRNPWPGTGVPLGKKEKDETRARISGEEMGTQCSWLLLSSLSGFCFWLDVIFPKYPEFTTCITSNAFAHWSEDYFSELKLTQSPSTKTTPWGLRFFNVNVKLLQSTDWDSVNWLRFCGL